MYEPPQKRNNLCTSNTTFICDEFDLIIDLTRRVFYKYMKIICDFVNI